MLYLNFLFFFSCRSLPCMTLLDATSIWRKTKFLTLKMVSSKSFYLLFIEGYEHNCIWWKILNMLSSTVTFFLLWFFFFFWCFSRQWLGFGFWNPSKPEKSGVLCFLRSQGIVTSNTDEITNIHLQFIYHLVCPRMQNWSLILEEKTLNIRPKMGLLLWTRRQTVTRSNPLTQVSLCFFCFVFFVI